MDLLTVQVAPYATDPNAFVFQSPSRSRLVYGSFYSGHFRPAVAEALPAHLAQLRFHDLRHTFASILISLGKHPKVIQERMGHSSISVTFDRYGHLLPNLDDGEEALNLLRSTAADKPSEDAKVLPFC